MAGNEIKFSLLLAAREKVRPALAAAAAALDKVRQSGESLKKVGENLRIARENVQSFSDQGKQIITGLIEPVKKYEEATLDLAPAMARVTTDVTGGLERMRAAAAAWSGDHSRSSAEFLAVSSRQLEQWRSEEKAAEATRLALRAATGARADGVGTANTLNLLYQSLGDSTAQWDTELGRLGDALVRTRQIYGSSFDAATLADPLKDAMQSARDAKVPAEQLLATIGALNSAGVLGGAAGAAAKNVIDGLQAAAGPLGVALERTKDGQLDLAKTLSSLRMQYGEVSDMGPEMLAKMQEAFGPAWKDISTLLNQGERLNENFRAITNSAGTAAQAQDAVDSTLTGKWAQLDNQLTDLKVTIGEALIPAAKDLVPVLKGMIAPIAEFVANNPELVQTAGTWFVMATAASSVLSPVLGAAGAAASLTGNMIDLGGKTADFAGKHGPGLIKHLGLSGTYLRMASHNALAAGRALVTGFVPATTKAVAASLKFAAALMTNPITWIVLAVVAAATLIYMHWEPISAFFSGLWASIVSVFLDAWARIVSAVSAAVASTRSYWQPIVDLFVATGSAIGSAFSFAAGLIVALWQPISAFFSGIMGEIRAAFDRGWVAGIMKVLELFNPVVWVAKGFGAVVSWLAGFSLHDAGSNIMTTLWKGMQAMANKPVEAMQAVATKIRRLLPFSPAKEGPLRDLHKVKLVETLASAVRPAPLVNAMRATAALGMAAFAATPTPELTPMMSPSVMTSSRAGAFQGGGVQIGSVTIQISGSPERSLVAQLEAWIADPANAERLASAVARHHARSARSELA